MSRFIRGGVGARRSRLLSVFIEIKPGPSSPSGWRGCPSVAGPNPVRAPSRALRCELAPSRHSAILPPRTHGAHLKQGLNAEGEGPAPSSNGRNARTSQRPSMTMDQFAATLRRFGIRPRLPSQAIMDCSFVPPFYASRQPSANSHAWENWIHLVAGNR
jgi:hypothetical protein